MITSPIQELSKKLFLEVNWASALESHIEIGKTKPREPFVGGQAGYILILLHRAIVREMIMSVCRLFDDGAGNRESLVKAFHLLRKPDVRASLIRSEGVRLKFQESVGAEDQLSALEDKWKSCRKNHAYALHRLRSTRDSNLAHNLDTIPAESPVYNDLFGVLESAREIVGELARIVGTNTNGFAASKAVWNRRAEEYWDVLVAGATAYGKKDG